VRDLIRRMSMTDPLWGAPRIVGELGEIGSIRLECLDHTIVLGGRYVKSHATVNSAGIATRVQMFGGPLGPSIH